jgi:hypothetical protein
VLYQLSYTHQNDRAGTGRSGEPGATIPEAVRWPTRPGE